MARLTPSAPTIVPDITGDSTNSDPILLALLAALAAQGLITDSTAPA